MFRLLECACEKAGWTPKFWAGEGASHLWFPVRDVRHTTPTPAAFGENLALGLEAGVGNEENFWLGRAMRFGARMAECHPEALTFQEMLRHAEDPDDVIWVDKRQAEQSSGIVDPLALLSSIPSLNVPRPTEEQLRAAIHLPSDFKKGYVFHYFRFNRNAPLARATLRVIRDSARFVNEGASEKSQVTVVVDELARVGSAQIIDEYLAAQRHWGIRLITANQSYAQLRPDLEKSILTLPTLFFGSTDGGYSRENFLKESTKEIFEATADGRQSYITYPNLRHEHLEFLGTPGAKNCFLLRVRGGYCYAQALYPVSLQKYFELQQKGFPKVGELPGMIDQSSHF